MSGNVVFTSPSTKLHVTPNTAYTEAMRLDANGNLGIGMGNNQRGQITLHDGIEQATLTIELVKALQEIKGFIDYARGADQNFDKLVTAYEVSKKLEK